MILQAVFYFLPVYFQAVLGKSSLASGICLLAFAVAIIPFDGLTGLFMSKTGKYKPLHYLGFALNAIGAGLFSTLSDTSSRAAWICFQIISAGGVGIIFTASLPSTLAALPESDVAVATATYSFVRSFGLVWGFTVASIVFNGQVNHYSGSIADPTTRSALENNKAYAYASSGLIQSLPTESRDTVVHVYSQALRTVWLVMVAISGLGFLATMVEKHVELRKGQDSEFGLAEKKNH